MPKTKIEWFITGEDEPHFGSSCSDCGRVYVNGDVVAVQKAQSNTITTTNQPTFYVSNHKKCLEIALEEAPADSYDDIVRRYNDEGVFL